MSATNSDFPVILGTRATKLPVTIDFFQMTRERRADNRDWPSWLSEAWNKDRSHVGALFPDVIGDPSGTLSIRTLEGCHSVSWGDVIIRGVLGELYPCKPDIFLKTYRVDA